MTASVQPARPNPASQAQPRRSHRRPVLIALMTSMALAAMDTTIVSTAIPQVVRDLGGFSLFSWVFSSYLLTQTVTIPVQGRLADQWGRKPVLIMGTIIFLAGSALCASTTMVSLILFRGIQGIGAGGVQATVNTLAGDCAPRPGRCATGFRARSAGLPLPWRGRKPRVSPHCAGRPRTTFGPRSPPPPATSTPRSRWWPR
jgi:MFS family permease